MISKKKSFQKESKKFMCAALKVSFKPGCYGINLRASVTLEGGFRVLRTAIFTGIFLSQILNLHNSSFWLKVFFQLIAKMVVLWHKKWQFHKCFTQITSILQNTSWHWSNPESYRRWFMNYLCFCWHLWCKNCLIIKSVWL